ncbi:ankyrin repeat domain-containing protein [Salinisphaera hydrothermalis]|uniref:Pfs, nacht and ankyrin domain protein n=1 Tax=Salinisphaera hydrothermalis (strain C41B8) TaxID=1304275 RepID=A0A084IMG0_SALHC|nr:ankyrin repeat domain-containing protein [Salinisphaera hydrothermalis]KEZ77894.1 pfs, nacht and ankyrin domain protein [Salinisphaera hydrothermalis C41B8]
MKWTVAVVLAVLIAGSAAALAVKPDVDAICLLQTAHDRLRHQHSGWNCLHYAASRGDTATINAMLRAGADVDTPTGNGTTPLTLAAAHGQLIAVKDLLAHGAAVNGMNQNGADTPLYRAAANGHPAVVRALIAAGADIDARNRQGRTPLWINAARSPRDDTQIAHSLINAGAAVDSADTVGDTPLIAAASAGNADLVGYLIAEHAETDHRDHQGQTALFAAVVNGHADVVRQLLARGANPQARVDGVSPLEAARRRGEDDIARLLRANGASG